MTATIETRDVTVGEFVFHLSETGPRDQPTIVWLHGSGPGANALSNWEWMISELGRQYHCVAPDIIGFGESSHPDPAPQGLGAFTRLRVDTILALLDELGIGTATFVGNSMGGMISLALALKAPDRVDKLVLMGSGGAPIEGILTPGLLNLITYYDNPSAENMEKLLTFFVHDLAFFGNRLQEVAAARLPLANRPDVERSHRATFGIDSAPLKFDERSLANLMLPTLIVHGDDDKIVPLASAQYFSEHLPNSKFELFTDTGHWLQLEQGQKFAAIMRKFLSGS